MKVLLLNGPNLNLLGTREPNVYGRITLDGIVKLVRQRAEELGVQVDAEQSNEEGRLVTLIGQSRDHYDGIIFNPAAYTHTSVALRDAIVAAGVPCVEIHLSNIHAREDFRQRSFTAPVCIGQICGFGPYGYVLALEALVEFLRRTRTYS